MTGTGDDEITFPLLVAKRTEQEQEGKEPGRTSAQISSVTNKWLRALLQNSQTVLKPHQHQGAILSIPRRQRKRQE